MSYPPSPQTRLQDHVSPDVSGVNPDLQDCASSVVKILSTRASSGRWRWLGLALLGLTPVATILAQDQLTPATVAAWNATGPAPLVAQGQSTVTLPAGGQLARTYPAGRLSVQVVSRPFFGTAADKCPALEVGPASVTFVRTADGGGMLLLGDKALSLPQAIALGADGRSVQAIDLSLSYDNAGNQATLLLRGTSYNVAATSNAAQLEVVVSAGGAMAWPLDTLAVTSTPGAAAGTDTASGSQAPGTAGTPASIRSTGPIDPATFKRAFADAVAFAAADDIAGAEKALAAVMHSPANTAGWELELAGNLVQVVWRLREDGSLASAVKVARRILQHLNNCVKLASAGESDIAGSALEMAGFVQDRFFGDLKSAEASYRQALTVSAGQAGAQAALNRLLDARAAEQQKLAAWGHK